MFARAQRASKPFIASRRTTRNGGDHPETNTGVESVGPLFSTLLHGAFDWLI